MGFQFEDGTMENRQIVTNYIRVHAEELPESDPAFDAVREVQSLVNTDPEKAWLVTLELIDSAPNDVILATVAAGPLEGILRSTQEVFLDRAEEMARRDRKFRRCLTGVWGLSKTASERLGKYVATVNDPLWPSLCVETAGVSTYKR